MDLRCHAPRASVPSRNFNARPVVAGSVLPPASDGEAGTAVGPRTLNRSREIVRDRSKVLLPVELLLLLAARLRLDGKRCRRPRDQPGDADRIARLLAVTVAALFDAAQGLVDFLEKFPLAVARAKLKRVLLLDRRLVGRIGLQLVLPQMLRGEIRLLQQFPLSLEQALAEERELFRAHVLRRGGTQQFGLGQAVLLRRLVLRRLVLRRLVLRRPHRLAHQLLYCFSTKHCSNPFINRSCGRFFPMKTIVLERFSSLSQARPRSPPMSMCTP